MDCTDMGLGRSMDWIYVAQKRDKRQAVVNRVENLWVLQN